MRHQNVRNDYFDYVNENSVLSSSNTEEYILYSELQDHIKKAINKLPKAQKEVFVLSRIKGIKYKEIAKKLNVSETSLSKYLDKYKNSSCNVESLDIKFNPDAGYESLINNPDVKSANIIFIDSKLFENRTAIAGKFTGEEFKIILKKYFPFIEVIVITQNDIAPDYETISKYDHKCGKTPVEYYDEKLPPILDQCIRNIFEVRKITSELQKNTSWEKVMVEKIVNSVNGQGKFDEFTKNDIDDVIKMFQELQTKVEG
jgi:hypothetical protein